MKIILRLTYVFMLLACTQLVLTGCATPGSPSSATSTEILDQRLQNEVLAAGTPAGLEFDSHLTYGNVEVTTTESGSKRIVVDTPGDETVYDTGLFWRLTEPMAAGDQFVLTLTARTLEGRSMSFPVMVEMGEAPWTKSAIDTLRFDGQSRSHRLSGVIDPDSVGASTQVNLHLGHLKGVLEIQELELVRLPAPSQEVDAAEAK
jgi:hypothetical protein